MACDEGIAEILRGDLAYTPSVSEKRMFGGICFMWNGNMLCGTHAGGAMFRVGKENEAASLEIEGITPLEFTSRKTGGMVDVTDKTLADESLCGALIKLAREFVGDLSSK